MLQIREEITEVQNGTYELSDNVLKNAPHTQSAVLAETWTKKYSRQKAVFPLPFIKANKFWPSVGRVNNPHGDRNLICTCPPIEAFETQEAVLN
jgi:glycine dehydrogenase